MWEHNIDLSVGGDLAVNDEGIGRTVQANPYILGVQRIGVGSDRALGHWK